MVMEFSAESGKIVRLREYMDTARAWEVKDKHGIF